MAEVAVVGGGIAGLSTAHELVRRGHSVTLFEAAPRAGGLLRSERLDGFLCEWAANGFLDNMDGGALDLARTLGVEIVSSRTEAKRRWIWRRGSLREVPASPPAFLRSDLLSFGGKLRLFTEPLRRRARLAPKEEESVADFFRRRLGPEALDALVEPFVNGIFAGDPERLSLSSAFPRLAEMEAQHGSLFRAMLAGRKAGRRAPSMYAPRGGMGALTEALTRELGARVKTGQRVVSITAADESGGRSGIASGARKILRFADGATHAAQAVVLALPAPATAELVAVEEPTLAALLRGIHYVGIALAFATVPREAIGGSVDGFGFLVARGEEPRCLGCLVESSVYPERAPEGQVLFRLIFGGARDPDALSLSDDALRSAAQGDLERAFGIRQPARFLQLVRHPAAIPQYERGHSERVAEIERRAAAMGLVLAGNPYHGVSVNECVADAQRVVAAVTARLG